MALRGIFGTAKREEDSGPTRAKPRHRRTALKLTGAALLAWATLTGASASAVSLQANQYGVVSSMNGDAAKSLPQAALGTQLAAMRAKGVQVVRADAPWATVQPNPPSGTNQGWQWATTDAWAAAVAAHHLTWEPILDYAVGWAKTCPGFCAPSDNSTYATYAQAVAARYGPGGTFWALNPQLPYEPAQIFEIWNEENVSTYYVDPAEYDQLYTAARTAIHAVQPSASVVVGGLADDSGTFNASYDYPSWYLVYMFNDDPGLVGNVDGFALHPYGATAADVEKWTVDFRHTLNHFGENSAPIDVTEFGWPIGSAIGDTWRASQMSSVALALSRSNCGIRMLAPYTWISPNATASNDFGLVPASGLTTALRPAGSSWFSGLNQALTLGQLTLC